MSVHTKKKRIEEIKGVSYTVPNKYLFGLSFLIYFIPAAIRYGIGQDYFYTYIPMFNYIRNDSISIYTNETIQYNEIGFNLLNKSIAALTDDPQWLIAITSLFCLVLAFICIRDYSPDVVQSVFILTLGSYYVASYSLIRQAMAIAIFAFALRYIENGKTVKFMLCIALAATLHTASIVYVPFYFVARMKFTKKQYLAISLSSILGIRLLSTLIVKIVSLTRFAGRISFSGDYNLIQAGVIFMIFALAVLGMDSEVKDDKYRIYVNLLFVSACLIGLEPVLDTTDRLIYMFYYTNFITLPYIIKRGNWGERRKTVVLTIYGLLAVLWWHENLYYDQDSVLPYASILSQR